jgi:hypothetical protein
MIQVQSMMLPNKDLFQLRISRKLRVSDHYFKSKIETSRNGAGVTGTNESVRAMSRAESREMMEKIKSAYYTPSYLEPDYRQTLTSMKEFLTQQI